MKLDAVVNPPVGERAPESALMKLAPCAKNGRYSTSWRRNSCGRDRLLVDFDVGKIGVGGSDETDRGRNRIAHVDAVRANLHRQKLTVGLLEEIAILADAGESVNVGARAAAGFAGRLQDDAGRSGPPARVLERRPIRPYLILHQRIPRPSKVLPLRSDAADELQSPVLRAGMRNAQDGERHDQDGAPRAAGDAGCRCPARTVAHVFVGLLVPHAFGRRLEEVGLAPRPARIDSETDEIVLAEPDVVGGLGRNDRDAGLLGLEPDVERVVVVEHVDGGRLRRRAARGHVLPGAGAVGHQAGRPGRVGEARVQGQRMRGPGDGQRKRGGHRSRQPERLGEGRRREPR